MLWRRKSFYSHIVGSWYDNEQRQSPKASPAADWGAVRCAEGNTLQNTDSSVYFFVLTTNIKYYCYHSTILSFVTFTETHGLIGETSSCYLSFLFFHHFSEQFVFLSDSKEKKVNAERWVIYFCMTKAYKCILLIFYSLYFYIQSELTC